MRVLHPARQPIGEGADPDRTLNRDQISEVPESALGAPMANPRARIATERSRRHCLRDASGDQCRRIGGGGNRKGSPKTIMSAAPQAAPAYLTIGADEIVVCARGNPTHAYAIPKVKRGARKDRIDFAHADDGIE